MNTSAKEQKPKKRELESYQPKNPEEFYFDKEGRVLDEFQNKLREGLAAIVMPCFLSNELWNILRSVDGEKNYSGVLLGQFLEKSKDKDSVISKIVNQERFGQLNLLGAIIAEKEVMAEHGITTDSKDREKKREFKKRFPKFVNKLLDAGILYTPEEIMAARKKELADYKLSRSDYILGGVVTEKGKRYFRFGWNEAHGLVEKELEDLENKLDKMVGVFETYAKASDGRAIDARAAAKKTNLNKIKNEFEDTLDQYAKWSGLLDSIDNFRDLKEGARFDNALWDDFMKKHPTKKFQGKTYSTLPPEQRILEHPLVKFVNGIENRDLPLENRSGITIKDSGVKNSVRFLDKVEKSCGGNSSKIMDAARATLSLEKSYGEGFLMQQSRKCFSKLKIPHKYEGLKFTKSFYASSKFNGVITMTPEEIKALTNYTVSKKQSRCFELKITESHQINVKPEIDLTYRAIREMSPKGNNESDELIDAENPVNYGQVENARKKTEKVLKNKKVQAAMASTGFEIKLPSKESFRDNFTFEMMRDNLRHLESLISVSAHKEADFSFKVRYYQKALDIFSSKDFILFKKSINRQEEADIKKILDTREKEKAKYTRSNKKIA